jgi:hypothetical protein
MEGFAMVGSDVLKYMSKLSYANVVFRVWTAAGGVL